MLDVVIVKLQISSILNLLHLGISFATPFLLNLVGPGRHFTDGIQELSPRGLHHSGSPNKSFDEEFKIPVWRKCITSAVSTSDLQTSSACRLAIALH